MATDTVLRPLSARSDPTAFVTGYEHTAAETLASHLAWPNRDNDATTFAFSITEYQATLLLNIKSAHWAVPLSGRYNRFVPFSPSILDPVADAERIDSQVLRAALVAAVNTAEIGTTFGSRSVYLNGIDVIGLSASMAITAPLDLPPLAAATKGGYIALRSTVARFLASIILAAEFRRNHNLPGGEVTVTVAIALDGSLVLRVETDTITAVLEQAVLVRPFFHEDALLADFMREPIATATFDAESARRAFRSSVRAAFGDETIVPTATIKHEGEWCPTTLYVGETGVSLARILCRAPKADGDVMPSNVPVTADTQAWPFSNVSRSTPHTGARAWQMIDGAVFEVLPFIAPTFTVGLTEARSEKATPVVLWTDNGIRLTLAAMSAVE
jgi:hypothetical protein